MKKVSLYVAVLLVLLLPINAGFAASILGYQDFLPVDSPDMYYYHGDRASGFWEYIDRDLHIIIHRLSDPENSLTWFETDIRTKEAGRFVTYMTDNGNPGGPLVSPKTLADETGAVLVFSDDYFGVRKRTGGIEGIILRNGVILSDQTLLGYTNNFPPLEILAVYSDGRMRTFASDAYSAEDYLAMGVTDTFAFGPILVQNGMLGERMYNTKYSPYREPRCALGMIEPGHYILLTVKGRTEDSKGATLRWLADRMLFLGAIEAMNLDGGATTALYIMGDLITHPENVTRSGVRGVNSMVGVGSLTPYLNMTDPAVSSMMEEYRNWLESGMGN